MRFLPSLRLLLAGAALVLTDFVLPAPAVAQVVVVAPRRPYRVVRPRRPRVVIAAPLLPPPPPPVCIVPPPPVVYVAPPPPRYYAPYPPRRHYRGRW